VQAVVCPCDVSPLHLSCGLHLYSFAQANMRRGNDQSLPDFSQVHRDGVSMKHTESASNLLAREEAAILCFLSHACWNGCIDEMCGIGAVVVVLLVVPSFAVAVISGVVGVRVSVTTIRVVNGN